MAKETRPASGSDTVPGVAGQGARRHPGRVSREIAIARDVMLMLTIEASSTVMNLLSATTANGNHLRSCIHYFDSCRSRDGNPGIPRFLAPDEGQQVGVDDVGLRGGHAVRKALIIDTIFVLSDDK